MTKTLSTAASLIALTLSAASCNVYDDDDGYDYSANALVTIKPSDGGKSFVMQLDDDTTLKPTNITASPYGEKEVRAFASLSSMDKNAGTAYVNWLDSIRTKPAVASMGTEQDDAAKFGDDPLEVIDGWWTVVEDGYISLRFRTKWGGNVRHGVNLVLGTNPSDPYEVTFRHEANGDLDGNLGDGYVAFRLSGLPDTEGKYVTLTLKWLSFSGEKTTTFQYCTRK